MSRAIHHEQDEGLSCRQCDNSLGTCACAGGPVTQDYPLWKRRNVCEIRCPWCAARIHELFDYGRTGYGVVVLNCDTCQRPVSLAPRSVTTFTARRAK